MKQKDMNNILFSYCFKVYFMYWLSDLLFYFTFRTLTLVSVDVLLSDLFWEDWGQGYPVQPQTTEVGNLGPGMSALAQVFSFWRIKLSSSLCFQILGTDELVLISRLLIPFLKTFTRFGTSSSSIIWIRKMMFIFISSWLTV